MKIFVTGSTGYIGGAVVKELVQAGHQVTGLFHKPEKEALLKSLGAAGIQGDLTNVEAWKDQAADHEAILHAGFAQGMEGGAIDRKVVEALLGAAQAKGVTQSFIYTSGTWVLGKAGYDPANESTPTDYPNPIVAWRPAVEQLALQGGSGKLKTAVIRPGVVYGGKGGLLAGFWDSAVKKGTVTYIGKGENVWSCVYRGDLALLYRLVAEKKATGIFHGVDGAFPQLREVAQAVLRTAGKPGLAQSLPVEEARKTMGPFADALGDLDQMVWAFRPKELGWKPRYDSFIQGAPQAFKEFTE